LEQGAEAARSDALSQLAKTDENRAPVCENVTGASGEVDLDNGGTDAVILDDPERVRLSE
jgi:hypothetical protein